MIFGKLIGGLAVAAALSALPAKAEEVTLTYSSFLPL